jgi:hypothetical protein
VVYRRDPCHAILAKGAWTACTSQMLLMNLLPGLRDLRAPLAAGYLWLTAGWLYFAPQLPASVDEADGVLKDIYRVIEASGPVAAAAGLSFAAYIIGILSTGLLTGPISFTTKRMLPATVRFLVTAPAYILAALGIFWNRAPTVSERYEAFINEVYRGWSRSTWTRAENLVILKLRVRIIKDSRFRDLVLDKLRPTIPQQLKIYEFRNQSKFTPFRDLILGVRDHLRNWSRPESEQQETEKIRELRSRWESLSPGSQSSYMDYVWVDPSESDRETKLMGQVSALIENGAYPVVESILESTINLNGHTQDVVSELQLAPERLVGEKPATYDRWDRLKGEGEFREAIVPPLVAILIALFSRGVLTWPSGLLLLIPAVVILIQGMIKLNQADGQLIQTLEAEVIPSTSLARLEKMDPYWLRAADHDELDSLVSERAVSDDAALEVTQRKPQVEALRGQVGTTKPGGHFERTD